MLCASKTERRCASIKVLYTKQKSFKQRGTISEIIEFHFTFDETSVQTHDIGCMAYTCSQCRAHMFKNENSDKTVSANNPSAKFSLCYSYGKIKLPPIKEPPGKLKCLLTGNSK